MADPRKPRPRSESSSGRKSSRSSSRSSASANKGSNAGLMIGLGVTVVVIVGLVVFMNSGGGTKVNAPNSSTGSSAAAQPNNPPAQQAPSSPASTPFGSAQAGKPPSRSAPTLERNHLDAAEAEYRKAVQLWNESQAARKAGNTEQFGKLVNQSWRHCEQVLELVRPQLEWLDEADLEGWAMPAGYDELQRRRAKWLETRTYVKRAKPMERG